VSFYLSALCVEFSDIDIVVVPIGYTSTVIHRPVIPLKYRNVSTLGIVGRCIVVGKELVEVTYNGSRVASVTLICEIVSRPFGRLGVFLVIRIFDGDKIIGVMNFNNMIPVDETVITKLDLRINKNDKNKDKAYKILCTKELDWIQRNQSAIVKKANKLYRMIITDKADYLLRRRCVDFKKLERVLNKRIEKRKQ
jgi:protein AbiQ